jgi:hypothetical protein
MPGPTRITYTDQADEFQSLIAGIYGQKASLLNIRRQNRPFRRPFPTRVYAPGCSIFGAATLSCCPFWAPPAYSAHRVAGNQGPGNAAKGIGDLGYYCKWSVGAEFVAFLDVQPTAHSVH